jgi:hypothetical protein
MSNRKGAQGITWNNQVVARPDLQTGLVDRSDNAYVMLDRSGIGCSLIPQVMNDLLDAEASFPNGKLHGLGPKLLTGLAFQLQGLAPAEAFGHSQVVSLIHLPRSDIGRCFCYHLAPRI